MNENRRVIVAERPRYIVPTVNCFRLETAPMPDCGPGQLRIRTLCLSMDAQLYAKLQRISPDAEPIRLYEAMTGPALGRVEASLHPDFSPGELVSGFWAWQDYVVSNGRRLRKLDFSLQRSTHALSAYGASAFGAYIALQKLAPAEWGETVVVGTALGGLGNIASQIAKAKGCRVVGITGSEEKCQRGMTALGLDDCVSYNAPDFADRVRTACRKGVDVFVDTSGGKVLEAVVPLLQRKARIAACGLMATPHFGEPAFRGRFQNTMSFMFEVINRRITVQGLVIFDHLRQSLRDFHRDMNAWIDSGKIRPMEDIVSGLEQAPRAFQDIFEGRNVGKRLVWISD
ncbi:hypothetical protein SAMN04488038_10262 [Solimonas aquatica]|uniref:Enoyl reductase (ER) domain-containing protein n=1 Tax=Solimonas aquatica TaxID=489703 RepID=A0A1H9BF42_9GAMM|nr:NADP-dependent oxidoreductase [Solimonas aquatica]SEP87351.1 hypothetical protein SAMN04488038_10262 [Solimonas aquatica]